LEQRKLRQPYYHPLLSLKRRLNDQSIRYLTLGGPSTYGQGLQQPEEKPYPSLLSESVHNAAQRVGGPTLASLCTQSIVGEDQVYDVIVLEFPPKLEALALLAQRLRQRFPFATLIFAQPYVQPKEADMMMTTLVERVQGHLYQLPPTNNNPDLFLATEESKDKSQYTLSPKGHELVANGIRQIVNEQKILENPNRNTLGTWGSGDKCQLWYETGKDLPKQGNLPLHQFAPDRYALEVSSEGGSISLENPFGEARMVYFTYMTTSSSIQYSNKMYPKTKVQVNDRNSVLVDPYHNDDNSEQKGHVIRTSAIGKIAPGISKISFQVMEEYTLAPFRIVGVLILPEEEKQHHKISLEFAMGNPEPVEVLERDLDVL
jgi:hypothetical protein